MNFEEAAKASPSLFNNRSALERGDEGNFVDIRYLLGTLAIIASFGFVQAVRTGCDPPQPTTQVVNGEHESGATTGRLPKSDRWNRMIVSFDGCDLPEDSPAHARPKQRMVLRAMELLAKNGYVVQSNYAVIDNDCVPLIEVLNMLPPGVR